MLHRRHVVAQLVAQRPANLLVVAGLGSSCWDLAATGANENDFHFIGAMGQAAAFALGVAVAQPDKRVLLITGDGELLMGLGTLATIASSDVNNIAIVALDNETYAETGGQPTATARRTDLTAIAEGCGLPNTRTVTEQVEMAALVAAAQSGAEATYATVKVQHETVPLAFPPSFDGVTAMNRFRAAATRSLPPPRLNAG